MQWLHNSLPKRILSQLFLKSIGLPKTQAVEGQGGAPKLATTSWPAVIYPATSPCAAAWNLGETPGPRG